MTATDVADYLVRKGIPFRTAHEIVGKIVLFCEKRGLSFSDLKLEDWHSFSGVFEEDVMDVADLDAPVSARDVRRHSSQPSCGADRARQEAPWVSGASHQPHARSIDGAEFTASVLLLGRTMTWISLKQMEHARQAPGRGSACS